MPTLADRMQRLISRDKRFKRVALGTVNCAELGTVDYWFESARCEIGDVLTIMTVRNYPDDNNKRTDACYLDVRGPAGIKAEICPTNIGVDSLMNSLACSRHF